MRYILAAALGAGLSAGAAQAAVVDLTYTMTRELISIGGLDFPELYRGPELGSIDTASFSITLDSNVESAVVRRGWLGNDVTFYDRFDSRTGEISYIDSDGMNFWSYELFHDNASGYIWDDFGTSGGGMVTTFHYDILTWSVGGLPEVAPIPLPASLPLLAVGMAGIGFIARRRKT